MNTLIKLLIEDEIARLYTSIKELIKIEITGTEISDIHHKIADRIKFITSKYDVTESEVREVAKNKLETMI